MPAPKTELMRSLARLVRGLSALFWGLPITLLICVKGDVYHWFRPYGPLLPVVANGLLLFGILQLRHFQAQERVWIQSLERAMVFGVINVGLSPFLFFWMRMPSEPFFMKIVGLLTVSGILFLYQLNHVLRRLSAMLPDETLREETRLFTALNRVLLILMLAVVIGYYLVSRSSPFDELPAWIALAVMIVDRVRELGLILMVLLPTAMTMTLIWKIKTAILESVFSHH